MYSTIRALVALMFSVVYCDMIVSAADLKQHVVIIQRCLAGDSNSNSSATLAPVIRDCTVAFGAAGIDDQERSGILVQRGVAFRNLGDFDSSLVDLSAAVKLSPKNAEAARMRAWTLRELKRFGEAEVDFGQALSIEYHWQALLSRCVVRIDLEKFLKAIEDCEEALKQNRNTDSLYFTAWLYNKLRRFPEAITLLQVAVLTDELSARIFDQLAHAYISVGDKHAAISAIANGLALFPGDAALEKRSVEVENTW